MQRLLLIKYFFRTNFVKIEFPVLEHGLAKSLVEVRQWVINEFRRPYSITFCSQMVWKPPGELLK